MFLKLRDSKEINVVGTTTIVMTDIEFTLSVNDDGEIEIVKNYSGIKIKPINSNVIKIS